MEKRKKILLMIAAAVAMAAALLLLWWLIWGQKKPAPPINNEPVEPIVTLPEQLPPPDVERVKQENNYPLGIKQIAWFFAERFGSYSTDDRFKNLDDLADQMTDKLKVQIARLKAQSPLGKAAYEGYESLALSSDLLAFTKDSATILVRLQRSHYTAEKVEPEVYYQNLLLKFVKNQNAWQADEAVWQ